MRKLYLIILIGILWAFGLAEGRAQHQVVTGRLVLSGEQEKEEVLSYANVAVLGLPDSLLVKGTSSDKDGKFSLAFQRKPRTEYVLKASFTGCVPLTVALHSDSDTLNLGTLRMRDDALRLSEVVVTAPLKAIEQKGDTTIYNVNAYPTPEGSYLEALVRRIPGLSYDPKTLEMKFNGYPIQEITVNGKDFFKGNKEV